MKKMKLKIMAVVMAILMALSFTIACNRVTTEPGLEGLPPLPPRTTITQQNRDRIADAIEALLGGAPLPAAVRVQGTNAFIESLEAAGITNDQLNSIFEIVDSIDPADYDSVLDTVEDMVDAFLEFGLTGTQIGTIVYELLVASITIFDANRAAILEYTGITAAEFDRYYGIEVQAVRDVAALGRNSVVTAVGVPAEIGLRFTRLDNLITLDPGNIDVDDPLFGLSRAEFIDAVTSLASEAQAALNMLTDGLISTYRDIFRVTSRLMFPSQSRIEDEIAWLEEELELLGSEDWIEQNLARWRRLPSEIPARVNMANAAMGRVANNFGAIRSAARAGLSVINRDWAGRFYDAAILMESRMEATRLVGRVMGAAVASAKANDITPELIASISTDFIVAFETWYSLAEWEEYREEEEQWVLEDAEWVFEGAVRFNTLNPGDAVDLDCWLAEEIYWLIGYLFFGDDGWGTVWGTW